MSRSGRGSFNKVDLGVGLLIGLAAYYLLSLASALWTSRLEPPFVAWAVVVSGIASALLGFASTLRLMVPVVATTVLVLLAATGFVLGSSLYDWASPLPFDFQTLLLHGGRSPFVIGAAAFLGAASAARSAKLGRLESQTAPAQQDARGSSRN